MNKTPDDAILVYTQRSVAFSSSSFDDCDDEIGVSLEAPDGGSYGEMSWRFKTFNFYNHGVQMQVFGDGLTCLFDPRIQRVISKWRTQSAPDEITRIEFIELLEGEGVVPSKYQIRGQQESKGKR
jgi:hypothetical protein